MGTKKVQKEEQEVTSHPKQILYKRICRLSDAQINTKINALLDTITGKNNAPALAIETAKAEAMTCVQVLKNRQERKAKR